MSIFEEYGALNKGVSPLGNTYTGDLAGIQTGLEFIAKLDPVRKKNCAYLIDGQPAITTALRCQVLRNKIELVLDKKNIKGRIGEKMKWIKDTLDIWPQRNWVNELANRQVEEAVTEMSLPDVQIELDFDKKESVIEMKKQMTIKWNLKYACSDKVTNIQDVYTEVGKCNCFVRKTGSDILTTLIQGFNFTNSRFQLHEFNFTNSTSWIHEFNFTNSRIQLHEFNFTNLASRIHEFNFTNSRIQLPEFNFTNSAFEFVKLNSWIREVEFVKWNSWSWIREFVKLNLWSWIREVEFGNSWSWNREFVKLKPWINEVEMLLPVFRSFGQHDRPTVSVVNQILCCHSKLNRHRPSTELYRVCVIQSTLVISTSLISNNRLSRSENLVPVKHRDLPTSNKILWKRGETAP